MPLVALLTDFGLTDTFVGVMHAVIACIAPEAQVVDLTHAVPAQDIQSGSWHLAIAAPYLSAGSVVCAVVDPGVGTTRRAIAVKAGPLTYVAPDNGLLSRVLALYAPEPVVVLDNPAWWLQRPDGATSSTFHGRDIFAPVAAHLARGEALANMGTAIDPVTLTRLPISAPIRDGDILTGHIAHIDHFGNLITDLTLQAIFAPTAITAQLRAYTVTARATTFGQGPDEELFWYPDSAGYVGIALRNGNAAARTDAQVGDEVRVRST